MSRLGQENVIQTLSECTETRKYNKSFIQDISMI